MCADKEKKNMEREATFRLVRLVVSMGLILSALTTSVLAMLHVHSYDRSDAFKDSLLSLSGITVFFALVQFFIFWQRYKEW